VVTVLVGAIDSDVNVGDKVGVDSNGEIAGDMLADFSAQPDNTAMSKPNHNKLEIR
jgi:hypothetical protein